MRLSKAACYANHTPCVEAYTGAGTLYGQWGLFDGSVRDGLTIQRAVLSLAPNAVMFPRRAFSVLGDVWIAGDCITDYYKGEAIRKGYVVHRPDELATFKTIPEFLSGAAGTQAYASKLWVKTGKEIESSSHAIDQMNIYAAVGEPLNPNTLAYIGNQWSFIHSNYVSAAGFLTATSSELDGVVAETATLTTRTYVPATDTYTTSTASVPALRIRWQEAFRYVSKSSETYERGDLQLMILKAAGTPATKDQVTLSDGAWRIMSVLDEGAYWSLHLRRA